MEEIIDHAVLIEHEDNESSKLNHGIFSSSHINFFFSAEVKGTAFPQMNKFVKTIDYLSKKLDTPSLNIENDINCLPENKQIKIFHIFQKEPKYFASQLDIENKSIRDIESLFFSINKLILETENRTKTIRRINSYTTNYDCIVEDAINRLGLLCNVILSSNINNHDKFFEMLGYDYGKKRYILASLKKEYASENGTELNEILPKMSPLNPLYLTKKQTVFQKISLFVEKFKGIGGKL